MNATPQPSLAARPSPLPNRHATAADTFTTALGLLAGAKAALYTLAPAISCSICAAVGVQTAEPATRPAASQ